MPGGVTVDETEGGGSVQGAGTYSFGDQVTLYALAQEGCYTGGAEAFEIDQPGIVKRISSLSGTNGQYQWTKTALSEGDRILARGFLTYQAPDGTVYTTYTSVQIYVY